MKKADLNKALFDLERAKDLTERMNERQDWTSNKFNQEEALWWFQKAIDLLTEQVN